MTSVSVVVPVFNGAAYIADAIASIRAQERPPDQIVVVDDGSTDGSDTAAAACGDDIVLIRHNTNRTLPAARNSGVEAARGDIVTFLDADDLWTPDKLRIQIDLLRAHPDVSIVVGHTHKVRMLRLADGARRDELWGDPELLLSMGAAAIRRPAYERVGGFDTSLALTCDWDWFMRARELGLTVRTHPEVVQHYRRHEANLTEDAEAGNQDTLRMLRMSIGRRRASGDGTATSLPGLDHG